MKTQTTIRKAKIGVSEKYLNFLYNLKNHLENNNVSHLNKAIYNYNVNMEWPKFLTENNIVYKDASFYKWNDKIPVSIKIVNKFREHRHKNYVNLKNNKISKQIKISFSKAPVKKVLETEYLNKSKIIINNWLSVEQVKERYNKSESTIRRLIRDLNKKDIKQLKFVKTTRGANKILINKDYADNYFKVKHLLNEKTTKEIGLIRKFLKWIY
jgi:hypothetical protein